MKTLIHRIEKMKPFFEKISNNPYLRAIRDGFISLIPVILFSSFFLLAAYVPNAFGIHWNPSVELILMKAYDSSMGILGLLMAATVTKSLTENFNNKLPKTNQQHFNDDRRVYRFYDRWRRWDRRRFFFRLYGNERIIDCFYHWIHCPNYLPVLRKEESHHKNA